MHLVLFHFSSSSCHYALFTLCFGVYLFIVYDVHTRDVFLFKKTFLMGDQCTMYIHVVHIMWSFQRMGFVNLEPCRLSSLKVSLFEIATCIV